MKKFSLVASAASAMKIENLAQADRASYPGEPYRAPYLEHVAKDLAADLDNQIGDDVPDEMDHILCMFETYQGTEEWDRLGCDQWIDGVSDGHGHDGEPVESTPEPEEPEEPTIHWTHCANEGESGCVETCNGDIWYGAQVNGAPDESRGNTMLPPNSECNNAVNGDPLYGTYKACFCSVDLVEPEPVPEVDLSQAAHCADEGGSCASCDAEIWYGAQVNGAPDTSRGNTMLPANSGCNNGVNGDPLPGVYKACFCLAPVPEVDLSQAAHCADEGGSCASCDAEIWYGAQVNGAPDTSRGNTMLPANSGCNNGVNGDPLPGVYKACFCTAPVPEVDLSQASHCADEGGSCASCDAEIWYGAQVNGAPDTSRGNTMLPANSGCNNGVNGDPLPGVYKACFCTAPVPEVDLSQASHCADEGGSCATCNGDIWYGAQVNGQPDTSRGNTMLPANSGCNNGVNGDPLPGVYKACFCLAEGMNLELGQTYRMTVVSEPDRFMRHRGYQYWLDPNTDNSQLYLDDSSHTIRAALDGTPSAVSFESVNFPGFYLRHAGYTCQLNAVDGSNLFNMDASFIPIQTSAGIKLQSTNYPAYLLSHDNQRVRISHFGDIHADGLTHAEWVPTLR